MRRNSRRGEPSTSGPGLAELISKVMMSNSRGLVDYLSPPLTRHPYPQSVHATGKSCILIPGDVKVHQPGRKPARKKQRLVPVPCECLTSSGERENAGHCSQAHGKIVFSLFLQRAQPQCAQSRSYEFNIRAPGLRCCGTQFTGPYTQGLPTLCLGGPEEKTKKHKKVAGTTWSSGFL
ncbi:Hypothetical predicted protein [Marmota monax]|uniref:Uncharacterized protein n=1 Tax=Marmota monax TaxID=9995 RepID=A0A5E4C5S6_MARMO|nr:Hypothetical predicted protein [Marmota monax]